MCISTFGKSKTANEYTICNKYLWKSEVTIQYPVRCDLQNLRLENIGGYVCQGVVLYKNFANQG